MNLARARDRRRPRRSARGLSRLAGMQAVEQLESRSMFAADPITSNNPVWYATSGNAKIDGVINASEWANASAIVRTQANLDQSSITMRLMYSPRGLLIALDVRDQRLWSDGGGGGSGNRWEYWNDDSIALFFDPKNSRARNLPASGRVLAFNLGRMAAPTSGPGRVARWDYLRGNGKGSGALVTPDGLLPTGLRWMTRINGTVNNNSDVDVGWTSEAIIPWSALGMAAPVNGQTIGMNFDMSFDNDGRDRLTQNFIKDANPSKRLGDRVIDDHLAGVYGSYNMSNGGWKGPVDYAVVQFVDRASADRPAAITNLSATNITGYGARLDFSAPSATLGGVGPLGSVSGYEIRLSDAPFTTEDDWNNAAAVTNAFVPHATGKPERLRFGGLTPDTQYYVAVRGRDPAGRLGDIAQTSFTTRTELEDTSNGQRIIVSPNGGALMTEAGDPYIMIGGTMGVTSRYARTEYHGIIWDPGSGGFTDYSQSAQEGGAAGYFDSLASYGVNTQRVQLERIQLESSAEARSQLPDGMAWLEWRQPGDTQSEFNPEMRTFLHAMMEQAARTGMHLILQTFNNFNYAKYFDLTPFSTVNGGPIAGMDQFFWNPQVLEMCKARLRVLADWVRESPYAYVMTGFELVNEWDGGSTNPDQVGEMRQRSRFMVQLADSLRSYAPEINTMSTTIGLAPEGPVARAVFYSDAFDVLDPHFYTPSTAEPVNNPSADKSVRPAMDYGGLAAYWLSNRRDNRPVHNAEWDLVGKNWSGGSPYYTGYSENADPSKPYTLEQDEAIYRTTTWVSLASGLAGTGLRIGGSEIRDTYPDVFDPDITGSLPVPLSLGMRETQKSASLFVAGEGGSIDFDWTNFRGRTLAGRLGFANTGSSTLRAWGTTDGDQGLLYVLSDSGKSAAAVSGASLRLEGLAAGAGYDVEFWSTGNDAHVVSTLNVIGGAMSTSIALPTFGTDVMIKFKRVA